MNIKKFIPLRYKVFLKNISKYRELDCKYREIESKNKIFILGTPHHGNLGDQAIAYSEIQLITDRFKGYEIVEINIEEYYLHIHYIKKYIKILDVLVLHGGGNLGDQYLFDEGVRRDIIKNFPNNKIIVFPQTMYFSNSDIGRRELENSKRIYSKHKNLTLIAREEKSYKDMISQFKDNNVILTPDIVLYLNISDKSFNRRGALYCLRKDLESKLTNNDKEFIMKNLEENYKEVIITDTLINENISKYNREEILVDKWNQFRKSEIVITDRIHGMIFAAITGTPCIALSNYNHKVKGTYEWIKSLDYIKYVDNIEEIPQKINELKIIKDTIYDNKHLLNYYEIIINKIKE